MIYHFGFVAFDGLENRIGNARSRVTYRFEAASDAEAHEQAREIWRHEQVARRVVGWDGQHYPREPELVRALEFQP